MADLERTVLSLRTSEQTAAASAADAASLRVEVSRALCTVFV